MRNDKRFEKFSKYMSEMQSPQKQFSDKIAPEQEAQDVFNFRRNREMDKHIQNMVSEEPSEGTENMAMDNKKKKASRFDKIVQHITDKHSPSTAFQYNELVKDDKDADPGMDADDIESPRGVDEDPMGNQDEAEASLTQKDKKRKIKVTDPLSRTFK